MRLRSPFKTCACEDGEKCGLYSRRPTYPSVEPSEEASVVADDDDVDDIWDVALELSQSVETLNRNTGGCEAYDTDQCMFRR